MALKVARIPLFCMVMTFHGWIMSKLHVRKLRFACSKSNVRGNIFGTLWHNFITLWVLKKLYLNICYVVCCIYWMALMSIFVDYIILGSLWRLCVGWMRVSLGIESLIYCHYAAPGGKIGIGLVICNGLVCHFSMQFFVLVTMNR